MFLTIDAIHSEPWRAKIAAVVTDKITGHLPRQSAASVRNLPCLQGVELADPNFDVTGRIDLLLGIDILPQILMLDNPEKSMGTWKTRVGGTVMGTYDDASLPDSSHASVQVVREQTQDSSQELDDCALTRFWEVEQPTKQLATLSQGFNRSMQPPMCSFHQKANIRCRCLRMTKASSWGTADPEPSIDLRQMKDPSSGRETMRSFSW